MQPGQLFAHGLNILAKYLAWSRLPCHLTTPVKIALTVAKLSKNLSVLGLTFAIIVGIRKIETGMLR
jgi:hypothetical protein